MPEPFSLPSVGLAGREFGGISHVDRIEPLGNRRRRSACARPTVAEDLLSDVFFDVWRQAGRFEGRSAVTTWLLSIARFKALSARRRRTDVELDETIETTVADCADNAEVALEKKHQGEMLRGALTKLSPEHREIIDLVYYHEKSVDDAADILSIPRATVKTRMFYARKKLAELVQGA